MCEGDGGRRATSDVPNKCISAAAAASVCDAADVMNRTDADEDKTKNSNLNKF